MKANWKIALMCIATIAFVACKPNNQPTPPGPDDPNVPVYDSKVDVRDNSVAEWATLPAEYVVSATCPEDAASLGLKSMKVYADQVYINIMFEYDPEELGDVIWVPLHVILNTDNSNTTGGYGAYFTDLNEDVLLETAFIANGESNDYNPGVFKYWAPRVQKPSGMTHGLNRALQQVLRTTGALMLLKVQCLSVRANLLATTCVRFN